MSARVILVLIILTFFLIAALYAIKTPKWQAPDEPAHFNYIRTIAETGALPVLQAGDYDHAYLERIKAAKFPPAMSIDAIRYESYQPPLYYLAAAPVYLGASGGGVDAQVVALRMFSALLQVIVLYLAFVTVREIFPGDDLLALATVGGMATIPMHIAIATSISNDTAAELILALTLLLAVRRVNDKVGDVQFYAVGGILLGAGLLTKITIAVPGVLVLVAAEIARRRMTNYPFRLSAQPLLRLFVIATLVSLPMFLRNILTYGITDPLGTGRHDGIVVGQPTTAQMIAEEGFSHVVRDFFVVTFKSFWGQFGWMGVPMDERVYLMLFVLTAVAGLGFVLYAIRIIRHREVLEIQQHWNIGLLLLVLGAALIDYIGYNVKFLQFQGRYLFPAIIPIAFCFVAGLRELIARAYQRLIFAILYITLVGLDIAAVFLYILPQLTR